MIAADHSPCPVALRIAFDVGGILTKWPDRMRALMSVLVAGGAWVCVITDMAPADALRACRDNGVLDIIPDDRIFCASWSEHNDRCKTVLCESLGIDFLIDDRPDYCADGGAGPDGGFIGLVSAPRPHLPYTSRAWVESPLPPAGDISSP